MKNTKPTVFIFSVFKSTNSDAVNEATHNEVLAMIKRDGMPCKEVHGVYKQVSEKSIAVVGAKFEKGVELLCRTYGQESYLTRHADTSATLTYLDGNRVEPLGRFIQVKSAPKGVDNYTYVPNDNTYWITVKE